VTQLDDAPVQLGQITNRTIEQVTPLVAIDELERIRLRSCDSLSVIR
jgi:hypothetical protein